jgi:hypothetical protein
MKKFITSLFILKSICGIGQLAPNASYVQAGYNKTTLPSDIQAQNSIIAGLGGYYASANAQVEVRGANYAAALPGYEAAGFTNNGYACLIIDPNKPRIVSFHENGFDGIPKYARFEIGVALPAALQAQINNFILTGVQSGTNDPNSKNPYDPDQIRVECLYSLVGSNPSEQHLRHGFYESSVVSINPGIDDWVTSSGVGEYPFRVRFAPPKTGTWHGSVKIYLGGSSIASYTGGTFQLTVVSSVNLGHLSMANNTNILKLQYPGSQNSPPQIFYGVGRHIDVGHGPNNVQSCTALQTFWAEAKSSPSSHEIHRTAIKDLAAKGCNFVRIRLTRWGFPVEEAPLCTMPMTSPFNPDPKYLNNYSANEKFMWEMDNTLLTCELNDIHILLTLLYDPDFHITYTSQDNGGGWERNLYSSLSSVINRDDFFTDPTARSYFQKRLFYVEARWGYSTSIAAWEMINETERMGPDGSKLPTGWVPNGNWDVNTAGRVADWLCVMKNYLQASTIYPHHPVTNGGANNPPGYSGPSNDPINWAAPPHFNGICQDFFTEHYYDSEMIKQSGNSWLYHNSTPALQNITQYYTNHWNAVLPNNNNSPKKGLLFGEYGLVDGMADPAKITRFSALTFHNQTWGSLFTNGISNGLQLWDETINPAVGGPTNPTGPTYLNPFHSQFRPFRTFIDRIDFNTLLLPDRNEISPWWRGTQPTAYSNNENDLSPAQTYWMRTFGRDTVYGWTKNTTSSFMVDAFAQVNAYVPNFTPFNTPSVIPSAASTVQGLLPNTNYDIKIYDTWNPSGALLLLQTAIQTNQLGTLHFGMSSMSFNISNPPSAPFPDYAFIATKSSEHNRSALIDEMNEESITTDSGEKIGPEIVTNEKSTNNELQISENKNRGIKNGIETKTRSRIFPIPATDQIYVALNTRDRTNVKVYIIDELGRIVEKSLNTDNSIDVRELPNGFYTLKMKDEKHEQIFKLIIQR